MRQQPFTFDLQLPPGIPQPYDNHIVRKLSSMRGMYADQQAYAAMLAKEDSLHYEVYEIVRPALLLTSSPAAPPSCIPARWAMNTS